MKFFSILLLLLLVSSASHFLFSVTALAMQDEAYGIVTNVVDGDTFDVTIEKANSKITHSIERVRLADVDSPEMESEDGPAARDFTYAVLMNKKVYLDIDDLSEKGQDSYGRLICLAYMAGVYGQPLSAPNFNRLLVDSGHARLNNFTNNEFDPDDWRTGGEDSSGMTNPLEGFGQDLQQNIKDEILPQVQESAGKTLDQATRRIWTWVKGQMGN
ncbi:MAG: thermonuclease family protein [Methanothrix sp.]|nr:thermonuclease family protein [Methanothrix sp.]